MHAEQNELITRIGPGTPCGDLMRSYWQPAALVDEFDPRFDPRMTGRAVKAVRLLGQDLVLFRDGQDRWGLIDRACPHRGADLAFGRLEPEGLRCPFHGWKFATDGRCLETPAEPAGSTLCTRIRQRSYPVQVRSGVVFAWLGPKDRRRRSCRGSTPSSRRRATASPSRACGTATGCRRSRSASIRRIRRSCIATSRTSPRSKPPTAGSSAPPAPARWPASAGR